MVSGHDPPLEPAPSTGPATPTPSSRYSTPKLGDFSKLGSQCLFSSPATSTYASSSCADSAFQDSTHISKFRTKHLTASAKDSVRLGNFSKIFSNLLAETSDTKSLPPSPCPSKSQERPTFCSSPPTEPPLGGDDPFSDAYEELTATDDTLHATASDSDAAASSDSTDITSFSASPEDPSRRIWPAPDVPQAPVLSHRMGKYGPVYHVHNPALLVASNADGVSIPQLQEGLGDKHMQSLYPFVAKNGIHVFLDVSNIQISFYETLKNMHGIPKEARLMPLPKLNLTHLTNILVRGRRVESCWAACSTLPDTPEPPFVRDLRKVGYEVLLRERKRSSQGQGVHYVEDCVDEALHLRIGETYMEYGNTPGTAVIATGDAKPAPFSLGFLKYAEWMLRAGWNVEVVSWSTSLSSAWRNPMWRDQWGPRFRIIDLDPFAPELWIKSS